MAAAYHRAKATEEVDQAAAFHRAKATEEVDQGAEVHRAKATEEVDQGAAWMRPYLALLVVVFAPYDVGVEHCPPRLALYAPILERG